MATESYFQSDLIKEIKELFPECVVLKNDANYIQGFPDLLILYNDQWAALETKGASNSRRRPNQEYYIETLNEMSYARFINPLNKDKVLHELQQAFRFHR